jgi:thiol-disulfide isomerase/thioredoxin
MKANYLKEKHDAGLTYANYVATGNEQQQANWRTIYNQAALTDSQAALLGSFKRKINVIGLSGIWCGDCVQQCPLIQKVAEAAPDAIDLRWLDRDEHMDLQEKVRMCRGLRVRQLVRRPDADPLPRYGGEKLRRRLPPAGRTGPARRSSRNTYGLA